LSKIGFAFRIWRRAYSLCCLLLSKSRLINQNKLFESHGLASKYDYWAMHRHKTFKSLFCAKRWCKSQPSEQAFFL